MTVEAWTRTPVYTIAGTGPYTITHPYALGAIRAFIVVDGARVALGSTDFSLAPAAAETTGDLYLSPAIATTNAGRQLIIDRLTPDEQGWLATLGEREAGLAAQLDRMVQATQEVRAEANSALRTRVPLEPFDWADGTVPLRQGDAVVSDPTAAQANAVAAAASALAAAASAAAALEKENSMLRDRGAWVTGILYSPSDIFTGTAASAGTSYITQVAHIATTIAADLAAGRIRVFAAKGDAGAGTGDMLKTENLSGLTNYATARTNLGLQALATKAQAAFADILPAAVRLSSEGLASPTDTELATAAWAKAYADAGSPWTAGASVGIASGVSADLALPATTREMLISVSNLTLTTNDDAVWNFLDGGIPKASGYEGTSHYDYGSGLPLQTAFRIRMGFNTRRFDGKCILRWDAGLGLWLYEHRLIENSLVGNVSTGWGWCTGVANLTGIRLSALTGSFDGVAATIQATYR
jgi:hypothetical protein